MVEDFAEAARDFAEKARAATTSAVAIQNAFKAVEYALSAYAKGSRKRIPEAHYQAENLAHRLSGDIGRKFTELFRMYRGSYRLEDGERKARALKLMDELLQEMRKHGVGV
jgi:hypothetical protein